ncbi:hypothetical protein B0H10DRAFT_2160911 [Mycena sp. CBHHK59/15]|nr:hypothetical protein B0H10DRAFT_2160911 [Mycena sp. CBHHK59/15]
MPRGSRGPKPGNNGRIECPHPGCSTHVKSLRGLTYHVRFMHQNPNIVRSAAGPSTLHSPPLSDNDKEPCTPPPPPSPPPQLPPNSQKTFHPFLNGYTTSPRTTAAADDWSPYKDSVQFNVADFLFRKVQMSSKNIDQLLEMWALSLMKLLMPQNWGMHHGSDAPAWAHQSYEIWYRDPEVVIANMLENPDFDGAFDTAPYVELDSKGKRRWHDFMSANFAWKHSIYADDPSTDGSMYTPLFFGSDKTTVSVATGDVEYHPAYISLGNLHNSLRRGHRNGVLPFAFLAIPKSDTKYDNDPEFRKCKRQLYHASLSAILSTLKPGMTSPVVRRCPDGHFRCFIYDFGLFFADYPEQVMLAGIVQNWCAKYASSPDLDGNIAGRRTHTLTDEILSSFDGDILWDEYGIDEDIVPFTRDFPRADIHEMLSSDLLHQVIKGSFKDHLVTWVGDYLYLSHSKAEADGIMDEIDRRIAAVPAFPCLRRFKQGRRFKQWMGHDSKALMKVYLLPAIKGLVPAGIVESLSAFLDFCYLVRRADFDENTLDAIDNSVKTYHACREIFRDLGVRPDGFSLPRQHSMTHYRTNIEDFGAPGGICSSITESRHITAVKKPWRRSSRYEALSQMLLTNQRLDKLVAARADFIERGMVPPNFVPVPDKVIDDKEAEATDEPRVEGNVVLARRRGEYYALAEYIKVPAFPDLLASFLDDQLSSHEYPDEEDASDTSLDISQYPISVYHSAVATFYTPSDPSGIRSMRREHIRSTPTWRKHGPCQDCAFVVVDQKAQGFQAMSVVRIHLFFAFTHNGVDYPCVLVDWFKKVGRSPDPETGMWIVEPEMSGQSQLTTVVHLDTLLRGAHLIPVYGSAHIPVGFRYIHSLDVFKSFHVNKYIDHHANEIAF